MNAAALISGLVFGIGLLLSGMTDPARVKGFLDVGGVWQPALALVMGTALLVTFPVFLALRSRRAASSLAVGLRRLAERPVDGSLVTGAVLFGAGWGLLGLCPGPAVVLAGIGHPVALAFLGVVLISHRGTAWLRERARRKSVGTE